jgi:hypothetical protein
MVAEYVKKIFKYVKKVNMYGYNVHLREGRHRQHIKFTKIEHKPKKKVVKERRPRQETTIAVCEWTSGGDSSSSSSSDESRKNFTARFMQCPSSSLHMCLTDKGMESSVSGDESDTTSLDDLVELVHEQKGMLKKQANEIKELNALIKLFAGLIQTHMTSCCMAGVIYSKKVRNVSPRQFVIAATDRQSPCMARSETLLHEANIAGKQGGEARRST